VSFVLLVSFVVGLFGFDVSLSWACRRAQPNGSGSPGSGATGGL